MKVLVLGTVLPNTSPATRFRIEQWMKYWRAEDIQCTYVPFDDEKLTRIIYQLGHYAGKAFHLARAFLRRAALLRRVRQFDAVFLFEHAARLGPPLLERKIIRKGVPLILDFCDPIYMPWSSESNRLFARLKCFGKTAELCRMSTHVLAGNAELGRWARQFNANVTVVPLTIDVDEYAARSWNPPKQDYVPVIGWTGSFSTVAHLDTIREVLQELAKRRRFRLSVMGTPHYELPGVTVSAEPWQAAREVPFLQACDIGIMPLPADPWTKLRSHLKVRQFMGVGVPCVATPAGVITEVVQDGVNGFLAATPGEWLQCLETLLDDFELRRRLGTAARVAIEERYSGKAWARVVGDVIRGVAGSQNSAMGTSAMATKAAAR